MVFDAKVQMPVRLTLVDTEPAPSAPAVLAASLRYAPDDPFAVSIIFPAEEPADAVVWTFDRGLVRDGLLSEVGEGDVRLWPAPDRDNTIYIELTAPGGRALLAAPASALLAFLDATTATVPFGAESEFLDLDAELEALLGLTG